MERSTGRGRRRAGHTPTPPRPGAGGKRAAGRRGAADGRKKGAPAGAPERIGLGRNQLFTSATLEAVMTFLPSFSLTEPVTVICFTPLQTVPWNFLATSFCAIR